MFKDKVKELVNTEKICGFYLTLYHPNFYFLPKKFFRAFLELFLTKITLF